MVTTIFQVPETDQYGTHARLSNFGEKKYNPTNYFDILRGKSNKIRWILTSSIAKLFQHWRWRHKKWCAQHGLIRNRWFLWCLHRCNQFCTHFQYQKKSSEYIVKIQVISRLIFLFFVGRTSIFGQIFHGARFYRLVRKIAQYKVILGM